MAKKEFTYRGKTLEELQKMTLNEFMKMIPARQRRSLKRGFTEQQQTFLKKLRKNKKSVKTHCRDMVVLPEMVGATVLIHKGKEFFALIIQPEMIGHFLGEFALTRKGVQHSAPGIGATRSSASLSVK
jgi:small subunit ribosomal protein S19